MYLYYIQRQKARSKDIRHIINESRIHIKCKNVAGVYLFLVKEMKILLEREETAIFYVLVVVKY